MKKRTTLADIARSAGVSLMTVSRAVNNKPGISEELRGKILAMAEEVGYQPSHIARSLATNRTCTIGLVVPDNINPFFAQIARGVEDVAYENGYNIFLVNTAEILDREVAAHNSLWQKSIDGVILCSSRLPAEELETQTQRFPAAVLLNRELSSPLPKTVTINVNDLRGAQLAMQHFVNQGRSRIAYINGPATSTSARRRLDGYRAGLKTFDLPFDAQIVESCFPNTECGREATSLLLARRPDIDAIYAFNDLIAVGAMQICLEAGKHVPGDVAIIGVDDIPLATIIRPQLTTLHVNLSHIGRLAMHALLEIIEGDASPSAIRIEPELYVRDSA